jgi:rhomboid protease GluP
MFNRQTEGSVVCPSCRRLVGIHDEQCFNCGRRNPGMWGYAKLFQQLGHDLGFLPFVLYGCVLMYLITLIWDLPGIRSGGMMSIISPSLESEITFGASGAIPLFKMGRWWTLLSASFLHGGVIHIGFNMMWMRSLLPVTAEIYGASRTVIIFTVSSISGFFISSYMGAQLGGIPLLGGAYFTLGASASLCGLLGALVYSGSSIGQQAKMWAVFIIGFGVVVSLSPATIGVDNWAHVAGFGGGYLAARLLDPMKPEKQAYLFIALICIAAFVLSIVLSFIHTQTSPTMQMWIQQLRMMR